MNMHIVILFFFALVIIQLLLLPFFICAFNNPEESACSIVVTKIYKVLSFPIYIRFLLEVSLLLLLATFSEIHEGNLSSGMYESSFSFAIIILVFFCVVYSLLFIHWSVYCVQYDMEDSVFEDLYRGLRPTVLCRTFNLMFVFRRILFACIFTFIYKESMTLKFSLLIGLQGVYLLWLVGIRPFNVIKDNVLEIFNELSYFVLCALIAYFNTSSRWNMAAEWAYWAIMIGTVFGFFLISLCFMIFGIVCRNYTHIKAGISVHETSKIKKDKSRSIHVHSSDEARSNRSGGFYDIEVEDNKENDGHGSNQYINHSPSRSAEINNENRLPENEYDSQNDHHLRHHHHHLHADRDARTGFEEVKE